MLLVFSLMGCRERFLMERFEQERGYWYSASVFLRCMCMYVQYMYEYMYCIYIIVKKANMQHSLCNLDALFKLL